MRISTWGRVNVRKPRSYHNRLRAGWDDMSHAPWRASVRLWVWLRRLRWAPGPRLDGDDDWTGPGPRRMPDIYRRASAHAHMDAGACLAVACAEPMGEKRASAHCLPGAAPAGGALAPQTLDSRRGVTGGQADT